LGRGCCRRQGCCTPGKDRILCPGSFCTRRIPCCVRNRLRRWYPAGSRFARRNGLCFGVGTECSFAFPPRRPLLQPRCEYSRCLHRLHAKPRCTPRSVERMHPRHCRPVKPLRTKKKIQTCRWESYRHTAFGCQRGGAQDSLGSSCTDSLLGTWPCSGFVRLCRHRCILRPDTANRPVARRRHQCLAGRWRKHRNRDRRNRTRQCRPRSGTGH
jgi:hypothetical protein